MKNIPGQPSIGQPGIFIAAVFIAVVFIAVCLYVSIPSLLILLHPQSGCSTGILKG